ncbi:protein REDUCED CHLOROPLAST COVERAGE 2 isoform X3 [Physcomitrium patens]|uniref:Clu domain-containing protein n=1 Tax=Physcomitrium patens TaxID=3218 RepID=A0A2K1IFU7_PHYPA|nr:protein TSS-like isoform X3 [Physcomitrium patens]PNR28147.1 hypothetical protein PHYPA_028739 [Physcomitrium patens]|eukprot:XP_024364118.1 protein TSS-like isoform X3 [Physcomitrella patens]
MAPRTGKAKVGKVKGEKKKREEKILPAVLDFQIVLPDENQVTLKAISTDRLLDVRRLLAVNVETCHLTNYSFTHEVRGDKLRDSFEVTALKPCVLTIVEEDYTFDSAVAHVRRLLDIVACTHFFGPSQQSKLKNNQTQSKDGAEEQDNSTSSAEADESAASEGVSEAGKAANGVLVEIDENAASARLNREKLILKGKPEAMAAMAAAKEATERGDMAGMCPPSKLGQFYEFFSFSHITPPIQFIRRSSRSSSENNLGTNFLVLDVRLCNGKLVTVAVNEKGFSSCTKQLYHDHSLVVLLRSLSKAFSKAYDDLMRALLERNRFGNLPYGFRSNTWVVPPVAADAPSEFPLLPTEDSAWGGNGGGRGKNELSCVRNWAQDFTTLATMPCSTPEEREIRDRKAFLLHSNFVDRAVTEATNIIEQHYDGGLQDEVFSEERGYIKFSLRRDVSDTIKKTELKIGSNQFPELGEADLAKRNLLKGVTANESTTIHDTASLVLVFVRHRGYIVLAEAAGPVQEGEENASTDVDVDDLPDGGANALNVNSLRTLLHCKVKGSARTAADAEQIQNARDLVTSILQKSMTTLESEEDRNPSSMRWELGACWVQHLQSEAAILKERKQSTAKESKGGDSKTTVKSASAPPEQSQSAEDSAQKAGNAVPELSVPAELLKHIPPCARARLNESAALLACKSLEELMDGARHYYEDVALPKLVADFGSLELSPVDGRTLTDFMHTRGLQMRSLGRVAELAVKLPHVQALCVHEMVVRAYKHVLQALVAATKSTSDLSANIAEALNFMLGSASEDRTSAVSQWVKIFVSKRFGWKLDQSQANADIRKYAVLRGLCHKVGIEVAPRDYAFDCATPFKKADIISMVPVYKQVACSSADGRTLLESSKAALDKGKLDDAVAYGTKALAKLVAVCGPYHRMTAGAYSLLAVVLYHTGDFNQATIYQQKALDINERELGLDHPDTMKSYGDLAVFYYRLQHTELALKYVNRALYLLHLICGPSHPNTAATYINVAMMEEGLGNIHVALRYLHEALKCNQRLLGADHIQTAASYHAIAIALSLMEAYSLSVQHEQTTLQILQTKLGSDDLRTQDAAAWLEYFDSKALEQQEAARMGMPKPDASIASKGHLSVSDLLEYINEAEQKDKDALKRKARKAKLQGKEPGAPTGLDSASQIVTSDEGSIESDVPVTAVDIEPTADAKKSVSLEVDLDRGQIVPSPSPANDAEALRVDRLITLDDEEGWQEAVPRARSVANKRRPVHGYSGQDSSHKGLSSYHRSRGAGNAGGGDYSRAGRSSGPKANNYSNENLQVHTGVTGNSEKPSSKEMSGPVRRTPAAPSQVVPSTKIAPVVDTAPVVLEPNTEKKETEGENHEAVVSQLPVRQSSIKFSKVVPGKGSFSYKEVALTSPGSMLQLRSALEASAVSDASPQTDVAQPGSSETKSIEATSVDASSAEASLVESTAEEDVDNKDDVPEMITSSAPSIPSSAEAEVEPEERIIEAVEPSPPAQSFDTSPQDSSELSVKSVSETPDGDEQLEYKTVEAIEAQKTVPATNPTESCSEETTDILDRNDVASPGSDDDSPAAAAKRLSAAAPPFNPNDVITSKPLLQARAVAVTPFKDGRSPPVGGLCPQTAVPPVHVQATVAVTPICKVPHPTLAPLPLYYADPLPHMGIMHGMIPHFMPHFLPNAPLDEAHSPLRKVPSPTPTRPKKMNPDAEEFIPSYLRDPSVLPIHSLVTSAENLLAIDQVERLDSTPSIEAAVGSTTTGDVNANEVEVAVRSDGVDANQPIQVLDVDDRSVVDSLPSYTETECGTPDVEVKCVTVQ